MNAAAILTRVSLSALLVVTAIAVSSDGIAGALPAGHEAAVRAEQAITVRDPARAVREAEAAVAAQPTLARYRSVLGRAYLVAGRYASAETAFSEALQLDPADVRASGGVVIAQLALGRPGAARASLADYGPAIPAVDRGLLIALVGAPDAGVAELEHLARTPAATPRIRQNLALAYALAGRWPEARAMAGFDVGAEAGDARVLEWAARAGDLRLHVHALTGTSPAADDPGRPLTLALGAPESEAPALAEADPAPPITFAGLSGIQFAPRQEIVQPLPAGYRPAAAAAAPIRQTMPRTPAPTAPAGRYVVQLGAYATPALAETGWANLQRRNRALAGLEGAGGMLDANGRTLYRVSVAGLPSRGEATALCERVRRGGGNCFVRASAGDRPIATAFRQTPTRLASR